MVLPHPNGFSTRLRFCWLTSYPQSRIVRPSMAERRLVAALIIGVAGLGGIVWCVMQWADAGVGPLQYGAPLEIEL
jgi:hypothetical protein